MVKLFLTTLLLNTYGGYKRDGLYRNLYRHGLYFLFTRQVVEWDTSCLLRGKRKKLSRVDGFTTSYFSEHQPKKLVYGFLYRFC